MVFEKILGENFKFHPARQAWQASAILKVSFLIPGK